MDRIKTKREKHFVVPSHRSVCVCVLHRPLPSDCDMHSYERFFIVRFYYAIKRQINVMNLKETNHASHDGEPALRSF